MGWKTIIAAFAATVSVVAVGVSWYVANKSNEINRINSLISLRNYYFELFRKEAQLAETYRDQHSFVVAAGKAAEEYIESVRQIDRKLTEYRARLLKR